MEGFSFSFFFLRFALSFFFVSFFLFAFEYNLSRSFQIIRMILFGFDFDFREEKLLLFLNGLFVSVGIGKTRKISEIRQES